MTIYVDLVIALNFIVDLLLLLGTNRLCGHPPEMRKALAAAGVGGVYAGVCLLPGFGFLGNWFWRMLFLFVMSGITFGVNIGALRRISVFVLLSLALGGVAIGMGRGTFGSLVSAAVVILILCTAGFRKKIGGVSYVPVELYHNGKRMRLIALEDTGNGLQDPLTGRPVLVVNAETANRLVGLSGQQLSDPVKTVASGAFPGLRLIPFHSVGQSGGLLLALRIQEVKIGNWKGSSLVAFAPVGLDREGTYQALTGGAA